MKLIIGCGYLGRRVAALWRTQGQRVFATTRGQAENLRGLGLEPIVCDVLNPETCKTLPQVDTVLYCVGFDRKSGRSMRDVYVAGLENVLAHLPRPKRFLHVSSTSVYGQMNGEEVDECSPTEPVEENGRIVLDAEIALRRHLPEAVILRVAGIYGPGRCIGLQTIQKGLPVEGDPERWLNLIHVDDGAAAILLAEERAPAGAVFNVSDGHPVRRREYFEHAASALSLPPPTCSDAVARSASSPNRRISSAKLRTEFGFMPTYSNCREGLEAIAARRE
ncbi:MAG: SDR family oxidoreductase [Planctomycetes bacterium]|nr:SDR family oxidoreductase [Planctomycetota bacterium]